MLAKDSLCYSLNFFLFFSQETDPQVLSVPLGQGSAPFNPRSQLLPVSPAASVSVPNGKLKAARRVEHVFWACRSASLIVSILKEPRKGEGRRRRKSHSQIKSRKRMVWLLRRVIKAVCESLFLSAVHGPLYIDRVYIMQTQESLL